MSLMVHRRCQSKRWWECSWDSSRAAQSFGTSCRLLLVYDSYVTNLFFSLRFFIWLKTFHFARRPSNRFRFQFRNLLSLHCAFICFLHRYSTVNHKLDLVTLLMGALQSKYCELGWSRLLQQEHGKFTSSHGHLSNSNDVGRTLFPLHQASKARLYFLRQYAKTKLDAIHNDIQPVPRACATRQCLIPVSITNRTSFRWCLRVHNQDVFSPRSWVTKYERTGLVFFSTKLARREEKIIHVRHQRGLLGEKVLCLCFGFFRLLRAKNECA